MFVVATTLFACGDDSPKKSVECEVGTASVVVDNLTYCVATCESAQDCSASEQCYQGGCVEESILIKDTNNGVNNTNNNDDQTNNSGGSTNNNGGSTNNNGGNTNNSGDTNNPNPTTCASNADCSVNAECASGTCQSHLSCFSFDYVNGFCGHQWSECTDDKEYEGTCGYDELAGKYTCTCTVNDVDVSTFTLPDDETCEAPHRIFNENCGWLVPKF